MSGVYKDSANRSPQPFDYCRCRCNIPYDLAYNGYLDRNSTFNNSSTMTQSVSYTNTTKTQFNNINNTEKDEFINKFKNLYTNRNTSKDGNQEYLEGCDNGKDSPVLSDGTDLTYTHMDTSFETGEFLEGLHCSSCDKPLLLYTNLDFKLFENWINYVFYHKSFGTDTNENTETTERHTTDLGDKEHLEGMEKVHEDKAEDTTDALETPLTSVDSSADTNIGVTYSEKVEPPDTKVETDRFFNEYNELCDENIQSIGDITGSILMSSEETMFSIINTISPGEQSTNEKNQLFDSVKRFLQYCLGEDTIVHLTGSTAYDIDIDYSEGSPASCYSDLDIVLLSNSFGGDPRIILQKVYNELSNMQHVLKERNKCPIWVLADSNVKLVETAKVPIVIIETKNGLLCDISVNTLYPLLHTELFKTYIDEHPMVRPLMRIIKHWLLVRGLPTMKEGGFPSILWMSLFCNSLDASNNFTTTSNLEMLSTNKETHKDENSEKASDKTASNLQKDDTSEYESNPEPSDAEHLSNPSAKNVKKPYRSDSNLEPSSCELDYSFHYKDNRNRGNEDSKDNLEGPESIHEDDELGIKDNELEDDEEDEDYETNLSETYREMYGPDYGISYGCSIGQLWERLQGSREEYGIICSLEKCFVNLSKGLSVMDIVNRFTHIKNGSDYGGLSLFCKNIIRLIEMDPNLPFGTWLVYYYELNRAKEYMSLFSKRLEMLVTLLAFLRLICNNTTTLEDLKTLAINIQQAFGYDLSYFWNGNNSFSGDEYNSLYLNNQYSVDVAGGQTNKGGSGVGGADSNNNTGSPGLTPEYQTLHVDTSNQGLNNTYQQYDPKNQSYVNVNQNQTFGGTSKPTNSDDISGLMWTYLTAVSASLRIQLCGVDLATNIKLLIYHMFQQFKTVPNEIFERVQDNVYSIPVAIEPPSPIEEEPGDFGHRFECGLWDDSGWYIVVLQDRLCVVKVIKICIEWEYWWSKDFVSRRDTRSIFHGFVYRQLRLDDLKKRGNYSPFSAYSVNSPSILIKRGSLVLFNPCDIVSKLHVLKVVRHEQYISPSLYSTDFYTGVKCLYVLPGFEVDRIMCFEQISHKLKHYVEFRPQVTFCKLCGIVNMKKINSYTEYKIPQRKLRNAKYVICNQKYNYIYNLMQYKHFK